MLTVKFFFEASVTHNTTYYSLYGLKPPWEIRWLSFFAAENIIFERCDILAPWLVHWLTFYYPTSHNEIKKKTYCLVIYLSINQSKSHIISSLIVAHSLTNPHLNTGCSINFYLLTGQKLFGKVEPCPTFTVDQVFDRIGLFQVF